LKILLDNCVHCRAAAFFPGHTVQHTSDIGWENLGNGELLAAAAGRQFEIFVTTDQNIRHQQNLSKLPLAVMELNARDTRIEALQAFAPYIGNAVAQCARYWFVAVYADGRIEGLAERGG